MRLLYLPAYYEPEKFSGFYLNKNIIEAYLQENQNNQVIIYTPTPTRGIDKETRKRYKKKKKEELYNGRLKIYRYTLPVEKNNSIQRALRYILQGIIQIIKTIRLKDIDVLMMSSTPPTNGIVGSIIKKIKKIPFVYNLQDIFPDSLLSTKIIKKKALIYKIGKKMEIITYKNADIINVPSLDFKENLKEKGVMLNKINVIYNWVDEEVVKPIDKKKNTIFEELNLDRQKFNIVYAGNIGKAQNIELILDVAKELKDKSDIQFIILGNGTEKEKIYQIANDEKLDNVKIFPLQPFEKASNVYSMSDISIVICKKGFGHISIPSKTWNIMATRTPIVASFDQGTRLQKIIEENKIGIFAKADDKEELKTAIMKFYEDRNLIKEYGYNAMKFVESNLTKDVGTKKYIESIKKLENKKERK